MTDKILTLDAAAAEIDRYTQASIAKINENANAIFSRIAEDRDRVLAAAASLDKLARNNSKRFQESSDAANRATTEMRSLEHLVKIAQSDLEELSHTLNIVRAGAESVEAMIGKPVRLKSGGFSMTAARLADDGGILCFWSNDAGSMMFQSIPAAALALVDAPD